MAGDTIKVRGLAAADKPHWDTLWDGYLQFYKQDLPQAITDVTWQRLMNPAEQPYGLVAVAGDRVVGFAHYLFHLSTWSAADCCYLEDLFVDPTTRGKGAGRALIEAVYRAADERGASRVYWCTEESNARARGLYDQLATLSPFVQYRRG